MRQIDNEKMTDGGSARDAASERERGKRRKSHTAR